MRSPAPPRTYLAIVDNTTGYVLDVYPNERAQSLAYYGRKVLGEYATASEAQTAVRAAMADICATLNIKHWWHA
jgi:hypothetical protein